MMTDKDRLLLQSLIIKFALSTLTLEEMEKSLRTRYNLCNRRWFHNRANTLKPLFYIKSPMTELKCFT